MIEDPELMVLVIPLLRADFEVCQTYEYKKEPPLDCPVTVFGGLQDYDLPKANPEARREHANSRFKLLMLPGGHLFLNTERALLLRILPQALSHCIRPTACSGSATVSEIIFTGQLEKNRSPGYRSEYWT